MKKLRILSVGLILIIFCQFTIPTIMNVCNAEWGWDRHIEAKFKSEDLYNYVAYYEWYKHGYSNIQWVTINRDDSNKKLTIDDQYFGLAGAPGNRQIIIWDDEQYDIKGKKVYLKNINDLSGLDDYAGYYEMSLLELHNQPLDSIQPLSKLNMLKNIRLYNTNVTDISPLKGKNTLVELKINGKGDRKLTGINVLKGLTNLSFLKLDNFKLNEKDIEALSGLTNLQTLELNNNEISGNLNALKNLKKLTKLKLDNNQISNIDALSGLENLEYLSLDNNNIKDISALSKLKKLKEISLSDNHIEDVRPIENYIKEDKAMCGGQIITIETDKSKVELPPICKNVYFNWQGCEVNDEHTIATLKKNQREVSLRFSDNRVGGKVIIKKRDIEAPIILEEVNWIAEDKKIANVILTADEEINITSHKLEALISYPDEKTAIEHGTKYKEVADKCRIQISYIQNGTDNVTIEDFYGNKITYTIKISGLDYDPPGIQVKYEPTTPTNQSVKVILEADEPIKPVDGWELIENDTKLTKTYTENVTNEEVRISDIYGNWIKKPIKINIKNIDKDKPYIVSNETINNSDGSVKVKVHLSEPINIISGNTGWNLEDDEKTLTKTYKENEDELVKVNDEVGNEFKFEVDVEYNQYVHKLMANITERESPILEDMILDSDANSITNKDVNVTLVVNEKPKKIEGWTLKEGTGEYENKWLLEKNYNRNIEEYVKITDVAGNEIIGDNVTNGEVHIEIKNIDRVPPDIKKVEFEDLDDGKVKVKITLNEIVRNANNDWNPVVPSPNTIVNVIEKTLDKDANETFEVKDSAKNIAKLQVDVNARKVTVLPRISEITYNTKETTGGNVIVQIVTNKEVRVANGATGWTEAEGTGEFEGRWVLKKVYENNTDEAGEDIKITDLAGNEIVGDDVTNGIINIKVQNIDREKLSVKQVYIRNNNEVCVKFNKTISRAVSEGWNVDAANGNLDTVTKQFNQTTTETLTVKDTTKDTIQIQLNIEYNQETGKCQAAIVGEEYRRNIEMMYISELPYKKYFQGDVFDAMGLVLEAKYNDGNTEEITEGFEITTTSNSLPTNLRFTTPGRKQLILTYGEFTEKFYINVQEVAVSKIELVNPEQPIDKMKYKVGETLNTEGLKLKAILNNGNEIEIDKGFVCTNKSLDTLESLDNLNQSELLKPFDSTDPQEIRVIYRGKTTTFYVEVVDEKMGFSMQPSKITYAQGEAIDTDGLELLLWDNTGNVQKIDEGYTTSVTELKDAGKQKIQVSYAGNAVEYEVMVEKGIKSVEVSKPPTKTQYYIGEKPDLDDLELLVKYTDDSTEIVKDGYKYDISAITDVGTNNVAVTYEGKETTVPVIGKNKYITELKIENMPKTEYYVGDIPDIESLKLKAIYNTGETEEVRAEELQVVPPILYSTQNSQILVQYNNASTSYDITVLEKENENDNKEDTSKDNDNKEDTSKDNDNKEDTNQDNNNKEDTSKDNDNTGNTSQNGESKESTSKENDNKTNSSIDSSNKEEGNNQSSTGANNAENNNSSSNSGNNSSKDSNQSSSKDSNENNSSSSIQSSSKDSNENNSSSSSQNSSQNSNQNNSEDTSKITSGDKEENLATSRLPQTGVTQIIIVMLIACAVVSGALFIKYRKI